MRIIFMGTPDFASGILEELIKAGHEIVLTVTQPDKPKGRGGVVQCTPVKETAERHGIEVFQPKKVRELENIAVLREKAPDIIVVAAFGQILPKEILELPKYGCVNVHASLLPKYRGASPIQWAVLSGEKESGVTIMRMDEGLDTGDIISQKSIPLAPDETAGSLFEKLAELGARLLLETLPSIEGGSATYTPQDEAASTLTGKVDKNMGRVRWEKSAEEIERWIRGLSPWPSAYTTLRGKMLKLWRAEVLPDGDEKAAPGTILSAKDSLVVKTGSGCLSVKELQLEGKKRMDAASFLRGYQLKEGETFGS